MSKYLPTIGLEIHANVKTRTKMFCACRNDLDEREPNRNTCPICLGHPGALPTVNDEAVLQVIRFGLAIGGTVAKHSHFDRKSYFYPDLPKGYQISQYEQPLVEGGALQNVRIRRVHLEEDAGRLQHAPDGSTLVDFNRAGVPLMELVTEPDIASADQAVAVARELQLILKYLGVSDADMEKGQLRVEANISVRRKEAEGFGTKVEVKNLNSFKAVHDAIEYEVLRQGQCVEDGEAVTQETRGWNDAKGITESQRSKESAHDYRYFPEPDLPPLDLSGTDLDDLARHLPELPAAKRVRFKQDYGIGENLVERLVEDKRVAGWFEEVVSELEIFKKELGLNELTHPVAYQLMPQLYNYLTSDLWGLMNKAGVTAESLKITPEHFAHFIALITKDKLSSRLAKNLLAEMFRTGEDPEALMQKSGVRVIGGDDELSQVVDEVISGNPKVVEDFKKGKENALKFLIGQGMAKTKGQANPEKLQKLIRERVSRSS